MTAPSSNQNATGPGPAEGAAAGGAAGGEGRGTGPLAHLVVADLTRVLAGPYATRVLADLGARVVKVELPPDGDDARRYGPFVGGRSGYYESLNHGKRSVMADLKDPRGRAAFEELLDGADMLVENFRPGVMERLGYGWETIRERWPRLVYAAVSGFGHAGPYAQRPAYDLVAQAMGGLMGLTGRPGAPPVRVGTSIGDVAAGLFTVIGILAALEDRRRTGRGQKVDIAMLDCQVSILENAVVRQSASELSGGRDGPGGEAPPGPLGSRHPSITPFAAFRAADRWLVIAAGNDQLFRRLCETLGRADLAEDPRFADNQSRTAHAAELEKEMEAALASDRAAAWLAKLEAAGVPCSPINNMAEVMANPSIRARNMIIPLRLPDGTILETAGNPVKLSAHPDPPPPA